MCCQRFASLKADLSTARRTSGCMTPSQSFSRSLSVPLTFHPKSRISRLCYRPSLATLTVNAWHFELSRELLLAFFLWHLHSVFQAKYGLQTVRLPHIRNTKITRPSMALRWRGILSSDIWRLDCLICRPNTTLRQCGILTSGTPKSRRCVLESDSYASSLHMLS